MPFTNFLLGTLCFCISSFYLFNCCIHRHITTVWVGTKVITIVPLWRSLFFLTKGYWGQYGICQECKQMLLWLFFVSYRIQLKWNLYESTVMACELQMLLTTIPKCIMLHYFMGFHHPLPSTVTALGPSISIPSYRDSLGISCPCDSIPPKQNFMILLFSLLFVRCFL